MATDEVKEELITRIPDADKKEFDLIKTKLAFLDSLESQSN